MSNYRIFSVIGLEIEYMLVDKDSLDIRPISDQILQALAGQLSNAVDLGDITLSNELVMHVLEFKNSAPRPLTTPLATQFQRAINELQPLLARHNLILLPTGAHPWMNPLQETKRWPHGNNDIYQQYDAIFDCKGHGWSNLQSMHVNLPYSNQEEFCQLHNLIRLLLPLIPALAASTPILEGQITGLLDSRLDFYAKNQQKIPSISGQIIPEFITTESEYQQKILNPMYADISPLDPKAILQHQWLNSRGAIPKFDYKAIEIRIIDTQECVNADIAIAKLLHAILAYWQQGSNYYLENPYPTSKLKDLYDRSIINGMDVAVEDKALFSQWQLQARSTTLKNIWAQLIEKVSTSLDFSEQQHLELILAQGNLSQRILASLGGTMDKDRLKHTYKQLAYCLANNKPFTA